jgi:hypothetical protein
MYDLGIGFWKISSVLCVVVRVMSSFYKPLDFWEFCRHYFLVAYVEVEGHLCGQVLSSRFILAFGGWSKSVDCLLALQLRYQVRI